MLTLEVGAVLPPLDAGPITRATLTRFAGASGDRNPIHIDPDAARAAGFDDVFAHGMLSMAYLGRLLTDWVPQTHIRELSARFVAITPIGARPFVTGVVTAVEHDVAVVDLAVTLDDGTCTLAGSARIALDPPRGTEEP